MLTAILIISNFLLLISCTLLTAFAYGQYKYIKLSNQVIDDWKKAAQAWEESSVSWRKSTEDLIDEKMAQIRMAEAFIKNKEPTMIQDDKDLEILN